MKKIPKIIHFCWFGGSDFNNVAQVCIDTWKKYLPDYTIKMWNEDNFDINSNKFVQQAYNEKKWAFVSDYVRLWALYHEGGIYLDTDVEILKNIDDILENEIFFGFENKYRLSTCIIGSNKNNKVIKDLLEYYNERSFYKENKELDLIPNTQIITRRLLNYGLVLNDKEQVIKENIHIYPRDYFSPKSSITKKLKLTENSYCIHQFDGTWLTNNKQKNIKRIVRNIIISIVGEDRYILSSYKRQGILSDKDL